MGPLPPLRRARLAGFAAFAAALALAGSLSYAVAASSFAPPDWFAGVVKSSVGLKAVSFADAKVGYAVGDGGAVLRSRDGGATWSALDMESTSTLRAVELVSATQGWAVGDDGALLGSVDGTSWSLQYPGVVTDLLGVDFADDLHGWIVGEDGEIARTLDGGSSWNAPTAGVPEDMTLLGVAFVDTYHGWTWGDGGLVARTGDGGDTWLTSSIAASGTVFYAGTFTSEDIGWVAGSGGQVLKTTDGGVTWKQQAIDTTAPITGISFSDEEHGFLVGGGTDLEPGIIAGTADGGTTWTLQSAPREGALHGVYVRAREQAWIAGDEGMVLRAVPASGSAPGDASDSTTATVPTTDTAAAVVPTAPVGMYARAMRSGDVLVAWTGSADATAAESYRISRSIADEDYTTLAIVTAPQGLGLVDPSAPGSEAVSYKVSAIGPSGESSACAPVTVVVKPQPAPQHAPDSGMTCIACHPPHPDEQQIGDSVDSRCIECHADGVGDDLQGRGRGTRHDLLPKDRKGGAHIGCASCHNPHGLSKSWPIIDPDDRRPTNALTGATDSFCLACHDGSLPGDEKAGSHGSHAADANALDIKKTWGSAIHGAGPSADPHLRPEMGYAKGDELTCATCHDAHGSTNRFALRESISSMDGASHADALLARPILGGRADLRLFCAGCHSLAAHPSAADGGADLTQWPIECTDCHRHGSRL